MSEKNKTLAYHATTRNSRIIGYADIGPIGYLRTGKVAMMYSGEREGDTSLYSSSIVDAYENIFYEILNLRDMLEKSIHILEVAEAYNKLDDIIHTGAKTFEN